jgi:hypothetical protein
VRASHRLDGLFAYSVHCIRSRRLLRARGASHNAAVFENNDSRRTILLHSNVAEAFARHPMLARRARLLDLAFDLFVGEEGFRFRVTQGAVSLAPHASGEAASPAAFSIRASESAWREFADPARRPGYHDVIALVECGHATVTGDLLPFFRNLFVVKGLVSAGLRGEVAW